TASLSLVIPVGTKAGAYTAHVLVKDGTGPGSTANETADGAVEVDVAIAKATPTVQVSDAGGTYDGSPFAADATVTGVGGDGTLASTKPSRDAGTLSFTYYAGSGTTGASLGSAAPSGAGTYTVVAHYASDNPNYASADSVPLTFTITQATPSVTV